MGPIVRKTCEVQLGLDVDLHALVLQLPCCRPLYGARPLPFVKLDLFAFALVVFQCSGCTRKWQAGLRIVRPRSSAAHTIRFQAPRNFSPPFGFSGTGNIEIVVRVGRTMKSLWRGHTYGYGL